ncbi:hypothetical protein F4703DRAFT_1330012 [Phycomyces blakesleeanus]
MEGVGDALVTKEQPNPLVFGLNPTEQPQEYTMGEKAVIQLLSKLDKGLQTIANLRSVLTFKTAELNEVLGQLEVIQQAVVKVETSTCQIELILKDLGLSESQAREALLMNAHASLEAAIQSASRLCDGSNHVPSILLKSTSSGSSGSSKSSGGCSNTRIINYESTKERVFVSRIRYRPDTKHLLRQLNGLLSELDLDEARFFEKIGTIDDVQVLQKACVDLDISRTIALSAKSNIKRRELLLRSARRKNNLEEVKLLGHKIREGVTMWKTYTRDAPMIVNGKDVLMALDMEDELMAKDLPVHPQRLSIDGQSRKSSPTPSASATARNTRISLQTPPDSFPRTIRRTSVPITPPEHSVLFPVPSKRSTPRPSSSIKPVTIIKPSMSIKPTISIKPSVSVRPSISVRPSGFSFSTVTGTSGMKWRSNLFSFFFGCRIFFYQLYDREWLHRIVHGDSRHSNLFYYQLLYRSTLN